MNNSQIIYQISFKEGLFSTYRSKPSIEFSYCKQVHGADILGDSNSGKHIESDGLIIKNNSAGIYTADCMPVLLVGDSTFFLHIGWRGLQNQIHLDEMIKKSNPYFAFIGPSISATHFEVTEEFKNYFPKSDNFIKKNEQLFFDLPLELTNQLKKNYPSIRVERSDICTYSDPLFHSYRRNKTNERNWNIFTPSTIISKD